MSSLCGIFRGLAVDGRKQCFLLQTGLHCVFYVATDILAQKQSSCQGLAKIYRAFKGAFSFAICGAPFDPVSLLLVLSRKTK